MVKTSITASKNGAFSLRYAIDDNTDPHDTNDPLITHRVLLTSTKNCTASNAIDEMKSVWSIGHAIQNKRIQAYRIIQSFDIAELDPHNPDDIKEANKIGYETASKLYPHRQFVVATQADGVGHKLHNHIIVNSLDFTSLKALRGQSRYQPTIAKVSDEITEQHGIKLANAKVTDDSKSLRGKVRKPIATVKMKERTGKISFLETMQQHLNKALKDSRIVDLSSAKRILFEYHVDVRFNKKNNGISYKLIDSDSDSDNPNHYKGRVRSSRLGTNYSRQTIEKIIHRNRAKKKAMYNPKTITERLASLHANNPSLDQPVDPVDSISSALASFHRSEAIKAKSSSAQSQYYVFESNKDWLKDYVKGHNKFYFAKNLLINLAKKFLQATARWAYQVVTQHYKSSNNNDLDGPDL